MTLFPRYDLFDMQLTHSKSEISIKCSHDNLPCEYMYHVGCKIHTTVHVSKCAKFVLHMPCVVKKVTCFSLSMKIH